MVDLRNIGFASMFDRACSTEQDRVGCAWRALTLRMKRRAQEADYRADRKVGEQPAENS